MESSLALARSVIVPERNPGTAEVVCSYNEWDPLEEVIVGILDGAAVMPWETSLEAMSPREYRVDRARFHRRNSGIAVSSEIREPAQRELDEFVRVLEGEGVTVRRPEPIDQTRSFGTPNWVSPGGNCQANPRDLLLVLGNEIIESPMSCRGRYFEFLAYRELMKRYFLSGAKWTTAPKPAMSNELYRQDYEEGVEHVLSEFEPVFDAADVLRCGRDLFIQKSHVTNDFGIEWLRRHVEDQYRLHVVEFDDYKAFHIDATLVALAPGKFLWNPERAFKRKPEVIARGGWDLLPAPRSTLPTSDANYYGDRWLSMNMLSLDERRVIVEKSEDAMIAHLKRWGFEPIPVAFRHCYAYGGSFHCYTVDIRRRGTLQSYF